MFQLSSNVHGAKGYMLQQGMIPQHKLALLMTKLGALIT
jgi:hypothetical protein